MSNTTGTSVYPPDLMLSIICGTIGSIGLPGNLFLIVLILSDFKKRKPHEWSIFTLAINDFLLCFVYVALEAPFVLDYDRVECRVSGFLYYLLGSSSLLTPAVVAYNRYLSLYDNAKYLRLFTNRNVALISSALVSFSFVCLSPFLITGQLGKDDLGVCGVIVTNNGWLVAPMIFLIVGVFVAYSILIYFSYMVIAKILGHKKNLSEGQNRVQSRLINESRDIIKTMLIISIIPLFSQFPGIVTKLLQMMLSRSFDPWLVRAMTAPYPLSSAMNGYITLFVVKDYRKATVALLRGLKLEKSSQESAVVPVRICGQVAMK